MNRKSKEPESRGKKKKQRRVDSKHAARKKPEQQEIKPFYNWLGGP